MAVLGPAVGRLVRLPRQQRRQRDLLGADRVHLLADHPLDLPQHPQPERQPRVDAGRDATHVTGAHEQLVAGHLGVGGIVAQRAQEQVGQAGDHGGTRVVGVRGRAAYIPCVLVLLPPSETKSDGGRGAPLDLGELSLPKLTERRELLVQSARRRSPPTRRRPPSPWDSAPASATRSNATRLCGSARPAPHSTATPACCSTPSTRVAFTRVQRAKARRAARDRVRAVRRRPPGRPDPRLPAVRRVEAARLRAPCRRSGSRS